MNVKNHYETLGVKRNASYYEIEAAYEKLVDFYEKALHEDPLALQKFSEIKSAYDVLMDEDKRIAYNQTLYLESHALMSNKDKHEFNGKDSIILTIFYFLGTQFAIPFVLIAGFAISILIQNPGVSYNEVMSLIDMPALNFYLSLVSVIIVVVLTYKKLATHWHRFVAYLKRKELRIIRYYFMGQIAMVVVSLLLEFLFNIQDSSANQQAVESMLSDSPLMIVITTVIFAPILEEIIFRGGLYLGIKNKVGNTLAVLISAVSFGAIHVLGSVSSPLDLLYILPYSVMGYFMVISVRDTDSIWGGIVYHFINNLVAVLLLLFVY